MAAIVESARAEPFDGLLAVGDRPTLIAAKAARALGLPWHPPDAAAVAGNKQLTRECLRAGRTAGAVVRARLDRRRSAGAGGHADLSLRAQAPGAVGQPRRHARR